MIASSALVSVDSLTSNLASLLGGGESLGSAGAEAASPLPPALAHGPWGLAIWALVGIYVLLVAVLALYGMHRGMLVSTCLRRRNRLKEIERTVAVDDDALPLVTIQLPLFNEATVAQRLIEHTAKI